MRRNKLYLILAIITIMSLFVTAATCNFCGIQLDTAPSDETKTIPKEEANNETGKTDKEDEEAETIIEENDGPEIEEAEPGMTVNELRLPVVPEETGSLPIDDVMVLLQFVLIGDLGYDPEHEAYLNGYISFDISQLEDIEIVSTNLTMALDNENGDRTHLGSLRLGTLDYGTGNLGTAAGTISANMLVQFPNSISDIDYSSDELTDALQKNINAGSERFQMKIYWSHPHNNDDEVADYLQYLKEDIYLTIQYTE